MKIQIPKGLFDILPYGLKEPWHLSDYWQYVESVMRKLANDYGFQEIRTPVFERTELFDRGVGKQTDIVSKEMYVFYDKAKRSLSLRPEGTSSVMRAFVEKALYSHRKTHKLYYIAPMFRYERPQAGRYRQHHQFGIEAIGVASAEQDVEVIDMLWQLFARLGLKHLTLHLNTIGDTSCKQSYIKALKQYLSPYYNDLSKDSQLRFEHNPLRILDSKDSNDIKILTEAPVIQDYLGKEARSHFDKVCEILHQIHIPFTINPKIVRGLDYYNRTVFEVLCPALGTQNAIGAGGRYDGFTSTFGGPSLPGIGFGSGLERIIQAMLAQNISFPNLSRPFVFLIPLGEDKETKFCFSLLTKLRHLKIPSTMSFNAKKIQDALQQADQLQAMYCLILGENELQSKTAKLKNMSTREEINLSLDTLLQELKNLWIKK